MVQDLPGLFNVQKTPGFFLPGQRGEPVQIGGGHNIFRRRGMHPGQSVQLPFRLFPGFAGQGFLLDQVLVFPDFNTCLIGFTQLFPDGFQLLPQIIFPLALVHVFLDLVLNFGSHFKDFKLFIDHAGDFFQSEVHIQQLNDILLVPYRRIYGGSNHICKHMGFLKGLDHMPYF